MNRFVVILQIFIFITINDNRQIFAVKTLKPQDRPKVSQNAQSASRVTLKPSSAELLDFNDKTQLAKCSSKWQQKFPHIKRRFSDSSLQEHCKMGGKWARQSRTLKKSFIISNVQADWVGSVFQCKEIVCLCRGVGFCNKFLRQIEGNYNRMRTQNKPLNAKDQGIHDFIVSNKTGANTIVKIKKPLMSGKRRKRSVDEQTFSRQKRQTVQDLADIIQAKVGKAQRKEIRMLNNDERRAFFRGLKALKTDMLGDKSKYDLLTFYHTPEQSPEAHFCASFLPFHRELLKNLEVGLRQAEPGASLPYWDTTLDQPLPDPKDSVLWTDELVGNGNGDVTSGPFADFATMADDVIAPLSSSKKIVRGVGTSPFGSLMKDSDVQTVLNKTSFQDLTYCRDPFLELVHGAGHMWVGGHMIELRTSPNDPVFFMYHAFIDMIWEQWRQQKQDRNQREKDYPVDDDSCNSFCTSQAAMRPFPVRNMDGLSNLYTDSLYTYDLRPSCTSSNPNCGSPYLFCDTSKYKCVSKVKPTGNCSGFESQDICYKSKCQNGRCQQSDIPSVEPTFPPITPTTQGVPLVAPITVQHQVQPDGSGTQIATTITVTLPPTVPQTIPPIQPTAAPNQPMRTVWIPVTVIKMIGQNAQQSYPDANIISTDNVHGMKFGGVVSDPSKVPFYTGASFAQVLNPFSVTDGVEATLEVFDENNQKCPGFCYNDQTSVYDSCEAKITLSSNVLNGGNVAYTPDFEQARVINWNGNKRKADKFMFLCEFC